MRPPRRGSKPRNQRRPRGTRRATVERALVPTSLGGATPRPTSPVRQPTTAGRDNVGVVVITPLDGQPIDGGATATAGTVRPPAVSTTPSVSARASQRRATELLRQGEAVAASRAFDALVMSNPLYEPRTSDLNPEALAAFRTSQKLILPVKAQRDYELAHGRARRRRRRPCARATRTKPRRSSTATLRTRRHNFASTSMPSSRRRPRSSPPLTRSSIPRPMLT